MNQQQLVREFFEKRRLEDPEGFQRICRQYPTLSRRQERRIRDHELCEFGLLGLQPTPFDPSVAAKHGLESVYEQEE